MLPLRAIPPYSCSRPRVRHCWHRTHRWAARPAHRREGTGPKPRETYGAQIATEPPHTPITKAAVNGHTHSTPRVDRTVSPSLAQRDRGWIRRPWRTCDLDVPLHTPASHTNGTRPAVPGSNRIVFCVHESARVVTSPWEAHYAARPLRGGAPALPGDRARVPGPRGGAPPRPLGEGRHRPPRGVEEGRGDRDVRLRGARGVRRSRDHGLPLQRRDRRGGHGDRRDRPGLLAAQRRDGAVLRGPHQRRAEGPLAARIRLR